MFSLSGKNAFVTGASGGLGRAIARMLHAQGATVVLADMRAEMLDPLKAELAERVFIVAGNLADPSVPAAMLKDAEAQLGGGVDILINNAGLARDNLAIRMKDEDWDLVLNVNLSAAFRLSRAALKGMMGRRWGRIISIASVVGVTGNPGQANYSASKAGLIAMSKSLAQEIASRNITVNCIAPGFIASAMTDALNDDQRAKILSSIPVGTIGSPDDVAAGVAFLASEEAHYITGQTLHINGGMAMI
ncbi:MAG: 3-oxoacyl-[acyl-carrier-protein] reductase [Alphaproteobacteria bacterium]|nr:3-oxoacyl-[acyl-carrier-protein] reductase [Alphaproteobacteria bacterium]